MSATVTAFIIGVIIGGVSGYNTRRAITRKLWELERRVRKMAQGRRR